MTDSLSIDRVCEMSPSPGKICFTLTEIIVAVEVVAEEGKNSFISKMGKMRQLKRLYIKMYTASELFIFCHVS